MIDQYWIFNLTHSDLEIIQCRSNRNSNWSGLKSCLGLKPWIELYWFATNAILNASQIGLEADFRLVWKSSDWIPFRNFHQGSGLKQNFKSKSLRLRILSVYINPSSNYFELIFKRFALNEILNVFRIDSETDFRTTQILSDFRKSSINYVLKFLKNLKSFCFRTPPFNLELNIYLIFEKNIWSNTCQTFFCESVDYFELWKEIQNYSLVLIFLLDKKIIELRAFTELCTKALKLSSCKV